MLRWCPLVLLFVAACNTSAPSPPVASVPPTAPAMPPSAAVPYKAAVTTRQLMAEVLEPASNVYWEAVGSTTDARGTVEKAPKTDAQWNAVRDAATIVAESGNLLMLDERARNHDEWVTLARSGGEARYQGRVRHGCRGVRRVRQLPPDLYGRTESAARSSGASVDQAAMMTGWPTVA